MVAVWPHTFRIISATPFSRSTLASFQLSTTRRAAVSPRTKASIRSCPIFEQMPDRRTHVQLGSIIRMYTRFSVLSKVTLVERRGAKKR